MAFIAWGLASIVALVINDKQKETKRIALSLSYS